MAQAPEHVDSERERILAGRVDGFVWDAERSVRFEVAMEALNRVLGMAHRQVRAARALGDTEAEATARARMTSVARRQELLAADDPAAIEAAIADAYPEVSPVASARGGASTGPA